MSLTDFLYEAGHSGLYYFTSGRGKRRDARRDVRPRAGCRMCDPFGKTCIPVAPKGEAQFAVLAKGPAWLIFIAICNGLAGCYLHRAN
jgi:hypothetical protein